MCPIFCLEKIVTPVYVLLARLKFTSTTTSKRRGKKKLFTLYSYSFSVISLKAAAVINGK